MLKVAFAALLVWGLFAQPVTAEENIHFSSCREAWENGYSDIHRGEPGYSSKLDRDGDGIACERANHLGESLNHASRVRNPVSQLADGSNRTAIGIILLKMGMQLGMLGKVAITLSQMARWLRMSGLMVVATMWMLLVCGNHKANKF